MHRNEGDGLAEGRFKRGFIVAAEGEEIAQDTLDLHDVLGTCLEPRCVCTSMLIINILFAIGQELQMFQQNHAIEKMLGYVAGESLSQMPDYTVST